jgi:hypothetical protein
MSDSSQQAIADVNTFAFAITFPKYGFNPIRDLALNSRLSLMKMPAR